MLRLGEVTSAGFGGREETARPATGKAGSPGEDWPQEVRELLHRLDREAGALRSERRALSARVAELEQHLATAAADRRRLGSRLAELEQQAQQVARVEARPDDHWLADVTDNTSNTLRSAQEAAQRAVARAKERAAEIERAAVRDATEIRKRAEAEAEKLLLVAHYDAVGLLQGAQASGEEILARARERQRRVLGRLEERRASLQAEIDHLESERLNLLKRYAKIKSSVDHAIQALSFEDAGQSRSAVPGWRRGAPLLNRRPGARTAAPRRQA